MVQVDGDIDDGVGVVGVDQCLLAAVEQHGRKQHEQYDKRLFHGAKVIVFSKILFFDIGISYFCEQIIKKVKKGTLILIIGVILLFSSCASRRADREIRRAERKTERLMARQARQSRREYRRAKTAHFDHQAPKTQKMMREDRKRARQLNRHLRR